MNPGLAATQDFCRCPHSSSAAPPAKVLSFFRPWRSSTEQDSKDELLTLLGNGTKLTRDRCGRPRSFRVHWYSQPHRLSRGSTVLCDSKSRLSPSLVKIITSVCSQGVGEANSFSGSGSLWNCFPSVWGLALLYTFCPWVFFP